MSPSTFLTDLDSRAAIKGSRDPLGLVPVWSRLGRYVVGNLTTVTSSLRGFTTLLLGYYFAQQVRDRDGPEAQSTLDLFLKVEQIAGYCRLSARNDGEFRGIDRVTKRLAERKRVTIAAQTEHQILSNQRVYGLWGLFSAASRASGLLERHEPILTPPARELVEREYISQLNAEGFKDGKAIIDLLRPKRADLYLDGRHAGLANCVAKILGPRYSAREREFYRRALVEGGDDERTHGLQSRLAILLEELPPDTSFDRTELRAVIKGARGRGPDWEPLVGRLVHIDSLESLITPAADAFGFLLARHGQRFRDVAEEVKKTWEAGLEFLDLAGLSEMQGEISAALGDASAAERWIQVADAMHDGDFERALRLLIEQNAFVMKNRGGSAPWVRLQNGRLDVRFQEETRNLPEREALPDLWESTYFINSLKEISVPLRGSSSSPQRAAA